MCMCVYVCVCAEMGSNEVQILCFCPEVDFSGVSTVNISDNFLLSRLTFSSQARYFSFYLYLVELSILFIVIARLFSFLGYNS